MMRRAVLATNHLKLALIHPTGNNDQDKPEWIHNVYSTKSSFRSIRDRGAARFEQRRTELDVKTLSFQSRSERIQARSYY
jgi:hypothetical protein